MQLRSVKDDLPTQIDLEKVIGSLDNWSGQCHAASLAAVKSGLLPSNARVARGFKESLLPQHSWVALGDPYSPDCSILDITAWSWDVRVGGELVPQMYVTTTSEGGYHPNGEGDIWKWGVPLCGDGPDIALDVKLSAGAQQFLSLVAHENGRNGLDLTGWQSLFHAPVGGWPAGEILGAAHGHAQLGAWIPIDPVGMLTDINPNGLYW